MANCPALCLCVAGAWCRHDNVKLKVVVGGLRKNGRFDVQVPSRGPGLFAPVHARQRLLIRDSSRIVFATVCCQVIAQNILEGCQGYGLLHGSCSAARRPEMRAAAMQFYSTGVQGFAQLVDV